MCLRSRCRLVSSGERTTSSNEPRMLVDDGGGNGPVSLDGAGERGDLAQLPGRSLTACDQPSIGPLDGGATKAGGVDRRAPTGRAATVHAAIVTGGARGNLAWGCGRTCNSDHFLISFLLSHFPYRTQATSRVLKNSSLDRLFAES